MALEDSATVVADLAVGIKNIFSARHRTTTKESGNSCQKDHEAERIHDVIDYAVQVLKCGVMNGGHY